MKILMLTPYLPFPLLSGGQIRSYNLLKNLSGKHEITLIPLIKNDEEKKFIPHIEKYCHQVIPAHRPQHPWTVSNILKTGFSKQPFLVVRNYSKEATETVLKLIQTEKFDLIHAETFYVMPHIPKTSIPVLLVEQTIEYLVYQHFVEVMKFPLLRSLFSLDVAKIKTSELFFWKQAQRVVAMSPADKMIMKEQIPNLEVDIVPNGVDCAFFQLNRKKPSKNPKILFVGNFKWLQNKEAVMELIEKIWPKIKKQVSGATLWIVGKFPPDDLLQHRSENIIISDSVEDIREAYAGSDVLLAPIYGPGGTRYKLLEAMASGVPVITTPQGIEGLGATDGKEAVIRGDADSLAQATVDLLQDEKKYMQLASFANDLVRRKYNWPSIARDLDLLYEQVAREKYA